MIQLKEVTLRRGVKVILDRASVNIMPGDKVGLIGRNGAGKSSLFALLTGQLQADGGDLEQPGAWRMAEVSQSMPETEDSATEFVLQGDTPLQEALAALALAEQQDDGHAMAEAHHLIELAQGFDAKARAQSLLMGLGFALPALDRPVNSFSGGWRMRLQLARALMCPSDLMLLDEPTNHLDLDALVWLEAWLQRYAGTLIIISHDREFLDAVTRVTVHLDDKKLTRYSGNYSAFETLRAERLMQAQQQFDKQQTQIAHLQKFIDRFRAKATKAKQAQSRIKALDRMEKLAPVLTAAEFQFEFRDPGTPPNPMLAMSNVQCGYGQPPNALCIVDDINRSVLAGERIGVLGANGQGKSTVIKTIARALKPLGGTITEGKGLRLGYFAQQELDVLDLDAGPLMHMVRLARDHGPAAREQELRDFLGSFRFVGEMATQAVGTLSGGEKARLVLAMLVWQKPHLLLLDEPTNHLDLETREALSMALNEFEGSVILVSHDRALLREVCDEFWLVTGGALQSFDGDIDDYQKWLLKHSAEVQQSLKAAAAAPSVAAPSLTAPGVVAQSGGLTPQAAPSTSSAAPAISGTPPVATNLSRQERARRVEKARPIKKDMASVEASLAQCQAQVRQWENQLCEPGLSGAQIADLSKKLAGSQEQAEQLELKWLDLQQQLDELEQSFKD